MKGSFRSMLQRLRHRKFGLWRAVLGHVLTQCSEPKNLSNTAKTSYVYSQQFSMISSWPEGQPKLPRPRLFKPEWASNILQQSFDFRKKNTFTQGAPGSQFMRSLHYSVVMSKCSSGPCSLDISRRSKSLCNVYTSRCNTGLCVVETSRCSTGLWSVYMSRCSTILFSAIQMQHRPI